MKSIVKYIFILLILNNFCYCDSIKINMIEKVSQFIQWPNNLEKEFIMAVYKNEQLQIKMQDAYQDKKIHELPIKVININSINELKKDKVNLIYITYEMSKELDVFLKELKNDPILIITDFPNDIYNENIHLALYFSEQKIKFSINQTALENTNLKASYQLLKLAKIIQKEN